MNFSENKIQLQISLLLLLINYKIFSKPCYLQPYKLMQETDDGNLKASEKKIII